MTQICKSCQAEFTFTPGQEPNIADGICHTCALELTGNNGLAKAREVLDAIDAPVLLMQSNPRQVLTANKQALELFGKELGQVENHRGGQVFDCIHSFTELGCGKDPHCEDCKIKGAIVDTFTIGDPFDGVTTPLEIKKGSRTQTYAMQVSTEKIGELALVRIDRYKSA